MTGQSPLRERKRQRAREAIIDAAFALFAERGFAEVTVTEIADRAEVGRTTFFRYFGDKQEVLFADEQQLVDQLRQFRSQPAGRAPIFREALEQARDAVRSLCAVVTADPRRYRLHEQIVGDNPDLTDRRERKLLHLTDTMVTTLRAQGSPPQEAALAAHLALACYRAGRSTAGTDPAALPVAVDNAFDLLLHNTRNNT